MLVLYENTLLFMLSVKETHILVTWKFSVNVTAHIFKASYNFHKQLIYQLRNETVFITATITDRDQIKVAVAELHKKGPTMWEETNKNNLEFIFQLLHLLLLITNDKTLM